MRSPTLRRAGLPVLLALAAVLPVTSLAGDTAAARTYQARRAAVTAATNPVSYGSDGRLTLLLLGSDWRVDLYGERMDVVMVVTIDPVTKRVAVANIPRDTVYIPRAISNGGGTSGTNRINAMYSIYYRRHSFTHAEVDKQALIKFKADVERLLATEIDYVAMLRMDGFGALVGQIGGVDVAIPAAIRDSFYRAPGEHHSVRGVYFPQSTSWHLRGNVQCMPYPKTCHNSLAYARSRHGTVGSGYNSDFARARRQQFLIMAGAAKLVANGSDGLGALLTSSKNKVFTNIPRTLDAASQLLDLVDGAHLAKSDTAVFSPSKWATENSTTPIYTFRPRLKVVRTWINDHFGS